MHHRIIDTFYSSFQNKDYSSMQRLYHDAAEFSDPVFRELNVHQVRAMWQMLLTAAKDLKVTYEQVVAGDETGGCHWEAWYTFTATGKKVHNIIEARFEFRDGLIYRHYDHFDLWRWSAMALGTSGKLLGWSSAVQNKIRRGAMQRLNQFMEKNASMKHIS